MTVYVPLTNLETIVTINDTYEIYNEDIIGTLETMTAIKICGADCCFHMICVTLWIYTAVFNMANTFVLIMFGEVPFESICIAKISVFVFSVIFAAVVYVPLPHR